MNIQSGLNTANTLRALGAALLLSLLPPVGLAQNSTANAEQEERWYQVEMLVFSRKDGGVNEHWRKDISLSYPSNWKRLQSPEDYLAEQEALAGQAELHSYFKEPAFTAVDPAEPTNAQLNPEENTSFEENTSPEEYTSPESEGDVPPITALSPELEGEESILDVTGAETKSVQARVDLLTEPYLFLPLEEHILNEEAKRLDRDKRYSILFHQSWRQPMQEEPKAPALLISGGKLFGEHRELEGSIKISIARYLHLSTQLWLTRFEPNYAQETDDWPELPTQPTLGNEGPALFSYAGEDNNFLLSNSQFSSDFGDQYQSILAKPYLSNRIVKMQQRRRMRSNELHFVDHPLFGLVIKITPYELPVANEELNSDATESSAF